MSAIWVIYFVMLKRNERSFHWTLAYSEENQASPSLSQRRHGDPAGPGPGRAGPLLACCGSPLLSRCEDLPRGTVLPEAARGEQGEQGDPHPGNLRFHLPHADGKAPNARHVRHLTYPLFTESL